MIESTLMSSIHVKYLQRDIQFLRVVMNKFLGLFLITLTGCSSFLYLSGHKRSAGHPLVDRNKIKIL